MNDWQLQWVHGNRRTRRQAEALGAVVRRLRQQAPLKVPAWRAQVVSVLESLVTDALAAHAWVGGLRGGVLTVCCDDPGVVSALRMRLHRVLLEALARRLPELGVVDVRFRLAASADAAPARRPADPPAGGHGR